MPNTTETGIFGLSAIGEWTSTSVTGNDDEYNTDNVYTLTPWGHVTDAGVQESNNVTKLEIGAATTAAILHSFLIQAGQQLTFAMTSGTLTNVRRMLGLPSSALTGDLSAGTPTKETLLISGSQLGTEEYQLYYSTPGFLGPRTVFFPRARVADFGQRVINRQGVFSPGATFDILENSQGYLAWYEDDES